MRNGMRRLRMAVGWAATLCVPALAHASGQLSLDFEPAFVTVKSHQACVAALEAAYAEDRKLVVSRTVEANGNTREVSLVTKGVERLGPKTARYDATIWYHNGALRTDLPEPQIETSHSYKHQIRRCDGRTMQTTGDQGYTLSTFDPVDAPNGSK